MNLGELIAVNAIEHANLIEVGQVLTSLDLASSRRIWSLADRWQGRRCVSAAVLGDGCFV